MAIKERSSIQRCQLALYAIFSSAVTAKGEPIDTADYANGITFVYFMAAYSSGLFVTKFQHSDTTVDGDFTDVEPLNLVYNRPGRNESYLDGAFPVYGGLVNSSTGFQGDGATDAGGLIGREGLVGTKRYVRIVVTSKTVNEAGGLGGPSGTFTAVAIKSGELSPTPSDATYGVIKVPTGGLTRVDKTATVAMGTPTHNFTTGMLITIIGANEPEYNGRYRITVIDPNTFTYTFAGSTTATATGTIYGYY